MYGIVEISLTLSKTILVAIVLNLIEIYYPSNYQYNVLVTIRGNKNKIQTDTLEFPQMGNDREISHYYFEFFNPLHDISIS